jgi:hypothetical protein
MAVIIHKDYVWVKAPFDIEPYGPPRPVTGRVLPFFFPFFLEVISQKHITFIISLQSVEIFCTLKRIA